MINVTTESELRNAISNLESEIVVENNINITTPLNVNYATKISGATTEVTLFWTNPRTVAPNMIIINAAGVVTIENIIFDAGGRDGTFIQINGGTFTMEENTILRNVYGRTANGAVKIGASSGPVGGTFNMNHGVITGIDSSDAVFNFSGHILMNNDATIMDNNSAGVSMSRSQLTGPRPSLTMSGNSNITNNISRQGASAGVSLGADIIMGVNPGDAPSVKNNRSIDGLFGGWYLTSDSKLIMRYNSEISGNYAAFPIGGLGVVNSSLEMYDNAAIINNSSDTYCGGVALSTSTVVMNGNSQISGNTTPGNGGGVYIQSGSILELRDNATISGNQGQNGGGIFIGSTETSPSIVTIGTNNSTPKIIDNIATLNGGGIIVTPYSILNLTGQTLIDNNTAVRGKGIYKLGTLNLSESIKILDGLYFDSTEVEITSITEEVVKIPFKENLEIDYAKEVFTFNSIRVNPLEDTPAYTSNVPIIVNALTDDAIIHLESSDYISPNNVPLVVADKGSDYLILTETDRQGWIIPTDFTGGYQVILNEERNQVWIVLADYTITYENLQSTAHTNPEIYNISQLPITLTPPTDRPDYRFGGWRNEQGNIITSIPVGTTGNLTLTAVWETIDYAITYQNLQGSTHTNPSTYHVSQLPITLTSPTNRIGYRFIGWRNEQGNIITSIPVGMTGNLTLTAVWEMIDYTITYQNLRGSTHTNPSTYHVSQLPITLTSPTNRMGYRFIGWRNEQGNIITSIPVGTIGNLTLTAVWKAICYTITYQNLQGSTHTNPSTYHVSQLPITLTSPTNRIGYRFIGWRNAQGNIITSIIVGMIGNIITSIPIGTTGNLTLTAVWETIDYAITYQNLQGSTHTNPSTYHVSQLPITLTSPTNRIGYRFIGWRNEQGNVITSIPVGTTGNLTLTAVWEILYLHFDGNACGVCNVPMSIKVMDDKTIIPCIIPYVKGYQFICWNIPELGSGKIYFPGDIIKITKESITLTAQWIPISCNS